MSFTPSILINRTNYQSTLWLLTHWFYLNISGWSKDLRGEVWSYWQSLVESVIDSHMLQHVFSDHEAWDQFPPICPLFSQPFLQQDMLLEKSVDLAQYSLPWYISLGGVSTHLLRDENNFPLFKAFCVPDDQLPALNVFWGEFQYFPNSHTSSGHEFQHKAVSWNICLENDFINNLFFQDIPWDRFRFFEYLSQDWCIAGILKCRIEWIFDEIEECWKEGVTEPFGGLFVPFGEFGEKRQNCLLCDRPYIAFTVLFTKFGNNQFIVPHRVFFSNSSCGTQ